MDSGTSGGSMQSGSSGDDDQNDTSSFSAGVASVPRLEQQHLDHILLPQTHPHQPITLFSSQQHLIHHYPPLTSVSTRVDNNNNITGYNNSNPHNLSSTNSFIETLPQSDLDRIWSMSMNVNPHHHHHHQQHQHMFYSSTSSLAPSTSDMNPNNQPQTTQDPQPRPTGKITTQLGKENGPSLGRAVKKRTRASRKTPTTVLTTDTTNFRAMVQEFTGIPTPPFGPSSLFPAKKFDLFGTNNGLDHQSLGSLLFSLNKSTNPNPSPNPFPPPSITTTSQINPFSNERDNQGSHHPYPFQLQYSQQMMMQPQGSNSSFLNNLPQGSDHNIVKNPNMAFHQSSSIPAFQSKYSNSGNDEAADQLSGFSNVERAENDKISRTG